MQFLVTTFPVTVIPQKKTSTVPIGSVQQGICLSCFDKKQILNY